MPVLDRVAMAGRAADEDDFKVVDYEEIPIFDCDSPNVKYALVRVYGDSMVGAGIYSGNWVLFRLCEIVPNGALAAVATPHGLTIKFYEQTLEGTVRLSCANREFEPQIFLRDEVKIRGLVIHNGQSWKKYHSLLGNADNRKRA